MSRLDDFDKLLKEKANNDSFEIPELLNKKIDNITKNLPNKKVYGKSTRKVLLVAAMIGLISVTTVFASNTSVVKKMVNGVVSYFNDSEDTKYLADKSSFEKFNNAVGVSVEDKDIKFTVDNVAVDDNFLNVFCTIESKEAINMEFSDESVFFKSIFSAPYLDLKINGKNLDIANNNDIDAYFEKDKVLKVMYRCNVSQMKLPNNFDLEILAERIFKIDGAWGIATSIDKSTVAVETNTVEPKINAKIDLGDIKHKISIDKVSISPFGNQILISERVKGGRFFGNFVLIDNKGKVLDVLNGDRTTQGFGKSTNSFEFIKADLDTEYLTLIPLKHSAEEVEVREEKEDISKLPIEFNTTNEGKIIVEKIDFGKDSIKITYHKDGVVLWDPSFQFYDNNGYQLDLVCGAIDISINRKEGKYTQTYLFTNQSDQSSKIKQIGTYVGYHVELVEEQQIKIDMQK